MNVQIKYNFKTKKELDNRYFLIAKRIAGSFFKINNICGVVIGGSLARGFADDISDIEMYVYYENLLPTEEQIRSILKKFNSPLTRSKKIFWFHRAWGYHTFFKLDGVKIELGYREINEIDNRMNEFLNTLSLPQHGLHDVPFGHYESGVANCIKECKILYDKNGRLKKLKDKLKAYPNKLRRSTIAYYLKDVKTLTRVKIKQAIYRDDTFEFNACLARVIRSLNICLFAINRVYFPGDKWNLKYISKFRIKPIGYQDQISAILAKGDLLLNDKEIKFRILNEVIGDVERLAKRVI